MSSTPTQPIDAVEAVEGGWLDLWYQPKIHARSILMQSVEAVLRIRHPIHDVLSPAFIAKDDLRISEFVIGHAIDDWRSFSRKHGHIEIAINLPISFLRASDAVNRICRLLPDDDAFEGLIIEIDSIDVVANLRLARELVNRLRFSKIAISIDDVGVEWPSLAGFRNFPFVEVKLDQSLVAGCADDTAKRSTCRQIIELASGYGPRTVAEGVGTWADFLAVREMGVDLVQGFPFAEPMKVGQLDQECWSDRGNAFSCPGRRLHPASTVHEAIE